MKLFIAEKPDLAKALISGMDGELIKKNGYFLKDNNIITWSFGHILELAYPEKYDEKYKIWNLADLPLKIDNFKYLPKQNAKEQLKIIIDLIKKDEIKEIVNCGDADEEGQILIDEIIEYSKTKKPVSRLLLQDLTIKGVKKSLTQIKSNKEFYSLSQSGFARSQADWIVGINLTRAYTKKAQNQGFKGVLSVGRVQTPILGLIVARDLEHESFKESFYFSVFAEFKNVKMTLKTDEKITNENEAKQIINQIDNKKAIVIKSSHEDKKENSPLPYNLLNLQADCSKLFAYKPDKTLKITQSLRENHKLITYNRSDCEYLPENMFSGCPEVISCVKANLEEEFSLVDENIKHKAFNDEFITAHFAIIPTANHVNKTDLSSEELNVYTLIAKRFIALFYPPYEYKHSIVEIQVDDYIFTSSSKIPLKLGFKEIFSIKEEEEEENKQSLEKFILHEELEAKNANFTKQKTKPKPYYTMSSLLKDLTRVSNFVSDEKIKKLLKEKDKDKKGENGGIGTPATRSEHIKNLFEKEYIKEEKKSIVSTKKARDLINIAPTLLTKPDMTALWFEMQKEIIQNKLTKDEFISHVKTEVEKIINELKETQLETFQAQIDKTYPCPLCKKGYLQQRKAKNSNKNFWGCSEFKDGCKAIFNDISGKPELEIFTCPKCGNKLFRNKSKNGKGYYWSCGGWRDGCDIGFIQDHNGKPNI